MNFKYRRTLILILFVGLVLPLGAQAAVVGHLTQLEGRVDLLKAGKLPAVSAKIQDPVEPGDVIRTKSVSKAQVKFLDDSLLTIGPSSRVAIEEYLLDMQKKERRAVLQVFQGLIHAVVNQIFKTDPPDFVLKTHTAVIGVRGTEWYAQLIPAATDVYNKMGETEVRNVYPEIKGKVILKDMEHTRVSFDLPPTLPLSIHPEDLLLMQNLLAAKVGGRSEAASASEVKNGLAQGTPNVVAQQMVQTNPLENMASALYIPPTPAPTPTPSPPTGLFHIQTIWGSGAYDLDLHLTGPEASRFHVYYANPGSLTEQPYSLLQMDSIGTGGSEVITINQFNQGGVYRASVYNYSDQSFTSTNLSSSSGVSLQVIRGGTVVERQSSSGTTGSIVNGGTTVTNLTPTAGQAGNTWRAVEINPANGQVNPVNQILNSNGSSNVE
ncbi:MAG: FecR family protein [Desulfobacca sp.]|nr:FecR family protein [Desulfobacca sp.]